jgi:Ca2+-binding RTX toxin-like protein
MIGRGGNDVYVVGDANDSVDEANVGGGVDTVESSVTFRLTGSRAAGDIENVTLTGAADIDASGNALANALIGNSGDNNLNGNSGADRMAGLGGDDSYVVNETGDVVNESVAGSSGIDRVLSFVSISLSGPKVLGSVENVSLAIGVPGLKAAGNGLANSMSGNNLSNDLMGLSGNDTLTGNSGADTFVFNAPLDPAGNVDVITDYTVADDTMRLENAFMPGHSNGTLAADAFRVGAAAADASDRVIYNDDTGALLFDRDGTGAGAAVRFATLDADLTMTNAEFFVI